MPMKRNTCNVYHGMKVRNFLNFLKLLASSHMLPAKHHIIFLINFKTKDSWQINCISNRIHCHSEHLIMKVNIWSAILFGFKIFLQH